MNTDGIFYKYILPSESAHRVDFSSLGMNNIEDVEAFLRQIGKYKLYDPQGLRKFANDMKLDVSSENSSDYLSVRKAFQDKYGIYMAFIEGNHRITAAGLIIHNIPISADIHSHNYMTHLEDITTFEKMFQQSYTTWINTNYDCSLPDSSFMVKFSSNINLQQEKSFGAVFSDIINTCKCIYDELKQSNQDIFVTLGEDNWLKVPWDKASVQKRRKLPNNTSSSTKETSSSSVNSTTSSTKGTLQRKNYNIKKKKTVIVKKLQDMIIPRYIDSICSNSHFGKELATFVIKGKKNVKKIEDKIEHLKESYAEKFDGHELTPVPSNSYSQGLCIPELLSNSFASNLHLLTVVSYDSEIFEMLQNLAVGNFSRQNLYPQKADVNKLIDYSTNLFSLRLSRTISSLVEVLHDHLNQDLQFKPRVCKIRQMFFIHFLREMLPVLLRLGNQPKIHKDSMKWLNKIKKKIPKVSVEETTFLDHLLFSFQKLFKMGFVGLQDTELKSQWIKKHAGMKSNSITNRGVIKLEFKDIKYSKKMTMICQFISRSLWKI